MSRRARNQTDYRPRAVVPVTAGKRVEVRFSAHAIARYQERVRPALDSNHAATECVSVIGSGQLRTEPPAWLGTTAQRPAFYICLADLAMPADPDTSTPGHLVIRTVLTRDTKSSRRRAGRQR
jgi:hypothetical protein